MLILKESTAVDVLIGPFVDKTDGVTAETGESPTVKLSKNGQALAAKSDVTTPVHDADGYYNCELDATDTGTIGNLVLSVAASANAAPVRHEFQVVATEIYDALYGSTANGFDASGNVSADLIASQSNTVTFPAINITGLLNIDDGIDVSASTANRSAINLLGNGTGAGWTSTGGTTGPGAEFIGGASGAAGATFTGNGTNADGATFTGDSLGEGIKATGGSSGGHGIQGVAGGGNASGIQGTGSGTQHGIYGLGGSSGGNGATFQGGTSGDGLDTVAGSGGVDIRGDITGDITGNLSGSAGSVTGSVGSVAGNVDGNVTGSVGSNLELGPAEVNAEADTAIADAALATAAALATVDTEVGQIKAVTDALTAAAATKLAASMLGVITGTATGGTTSTVTSGTTGEGDDTFNGRLLVFTSGTLRYEAGVITDYDSAAGTFTFAASTWTTSPTSENFIIL